MPPEAFMSKKGHFEPTTPSALQFKAGPCNSSREIVASYRHPGYRSHRDDFKSRGSSEGFACLVGADRGRTAHRLGCTQAPDEVVVAQHALHRIGEGDRDCKWQAFRDRDNLSAHTPALDEAASALTLFICTRQVLMRATRFGSRKSILPIAGWSESWLQRRSIDQLLGFRQAMLVSISQHAHLLEESMHSITANGALPRTFAKSREDTRRLAPANVLTKIVMAVIRKCRYSVRESHAHCSPPAMKCW